MDAHRTVAGRAVSLELTDGSVLGAVMSISDDAILTCDRSGRVSTWGATAVRLFGRDADDVVGRLLPELFSPGLRPEIAVVAARAGAGDRVQHHQTEVARADGLPMPVSLSMAPITDAAGRIAELAVVVRDTTEQYLTQATLAEMEARLQEGEALAHLGSWLWDVGTGTVQWSLEFHRIHGVDPLDFEGTIESHLAVVVPDEREAVRTGMRRSVESRTTFEAEYRIVTPGRALRRLHARAHPMVDSSGRAVGLRGVGQDVTDRAARS
jgi:PAS domain S-box-containing protein